MTGEPSVQLDSSVYVAVRRTYAVSDLQYSSLAVCTRRILYEYCSNCTKDRDVQRPATRHSHSLLVGEVLLYSEY